jgi:programmed cell death 8 (apoptosis-inducing factor)
LPYSKPPLSKELWKSEDPDVAKNLMFKNWEGKEQHVIYEPEQFYKDQQYSTVILSRTVVVIAFIRFNF